MKVVGGGRLGRGWVQRLLAQEAMAVESARQESPYHATGEYDSIAGCTASLGETVEVGTVEQQSCVLCRCLCRRHTCDHVCSWSLGSCNLGSLNCIRSSMTFLLRLVQLRGGFQQRHQPFRLCRPSHPWCSSAPCILSRTRRRGTNPGNWWSRQWRREGRSIRRLRTHIDLSVILEPCKANTHRWQSELEKIGFEGCRGLKRAWFYRSLGLDLCWEVDPFPQLEEDVEDISSRWVERTRAHIQGPAWVGRVFWCSRGRLGCCLDYRYWNGQSESAYM